MVYVLFFGSVVRYSFENKERRLFLRQMYIQTQQKQALSILDKIQDVLLVIKPDALDGKYQVVFSNLQARKVFNSSSLNQNDEVKNGMLDEYIFHTASKSPLLNSL
jgi:hypothetical protein